MPSHPVPDCISAPREMAPRIMDALSRRPRPAAMSTAPMPRRGAASHPIQQVLERLHRRFLPDRRGQLASYIPELAGVDPEPLGIVLVTIDGMVYEAGDTAAPFTIQSISK